MIFSENQSEAQLPSFSLKGQFVIVTGAGQGIGRPVAQSYARAGARLLLVGRTLKKLEIVRSEITDAGQQAYVCRADVRDVSAAREIASGAAKLLLPGERIVLVNNAGVDLTKSAFDVTEDDWDAVLNTHLKGTFFCSQAVAKLMSERGYGKIINVSSTWSESTDVGKSVYACAKAGVSHLTAALSTEWAPAGIRVNAIAPTAILTEPVQAMMQTNPDRGRRLLSRIPLGRFATTQDLIGAAIFLASEASDFVTGQTLFVDGGWNAAG